ncbi:MAG: hypothetical protein ACRDSK_13660 [Actinophytocola sp.]|uniref:hypothetical protein n=1 Tax=Actinophytocola sp. TaxID=1872138 RepID=UPI003D6BEDCA
MALADGQVQIRDVLVGPGTWYDVPEFNPFTRNVRAEHSGPRAWNHGSWSGVEWMDEVVVPMRIAVRGATPAQWLTNQQELVAAFRAVGEAVAEVELRFAIAGSEFLMYGRPRLADPDLTLIASNTTIVSAAFVALDPLIYAGTETVVGPIGLPTQTSGLTVPFTVPFMVTGTVVGGSGVLQNLGTAETGLLLRIDGPVIEPSVTLQRADGVIQTLSFDLTLAAGQWLDVDTTQKTALLNGTASRYPSGDWPVLPKGTHTIRWTAADYNATAALTVRFRSAWW